MRALALLLAVNTVLAIDFQCDLQDSTSQLFPHDTDARKYYACDENHKLIERVCPDESVFNKVLRICDKAESVSSGRSTCPNGSVKPDADRRKFSICISNSWRTRECPNGHVFSTDKVACVRDSSASATPQNPAPSKECKQGELKSDGTNSNKYFICVNNVWRSQVCPSGLGFNAEKRLCALMTKEYVTTNSKVTKECKQGELKADATNPNKFLLCMNNVWISHGCPSGQVFDAERQLCTFMAKVNFITNSKVTKDNCENGCVQQNPNCCDRFFLCVGGVWTNQSCQPGHYFDPKRRACVVDVFGLCKVATPKPQPGCTENCVKQDPHDCTKYLICKNGIWEQRPCPDGKYFDNSKKACVVDVWGTCIPQTQPPPTKCTDGCVKQDPECCDKYYVCSGGIWVRTSCPKGQYFEPSRQACIVDTWGVCVQKPIPPPPGCTEDCVKQDPHDCTKYLICKNGIWEQRPCPDGKYFDNSKKACVVDVWGTCIPQTQPPPTKCTDGCVKQDPNCCDRYFLCVGGEWKRESCPAGQYFEPSRQACIVDVNGVCTSATVAPQDCDGVTHGSMKPDEVCNKFWLCLFGIWRPQSCDPGKMFDAEKNVCVPDDGTCLPKPPKCEEGCVKQDPECCDKYYVCVGGEWVRTSCPKGQYFEPSRQACIVDTWGVCVEKPIPPPPGCTEDCVKQDPFDCTKYLICKNGIWEQRPCPAGQYFDNSKNACVLDVWGTCIPQTQPPPTTCTDGCVKQDPECCDKYYVCSGGIWVRTSCPKGQYFEPSRQACIVDTWGVCVQKPIPPPPGCTEDCVKQDPHDCTKYLICKNGIWEQRPCPDGKYFDNSKKACVVDVWGTCIPQTQPPPTKCTDGCVKQDPNCCDRYFLCVGGEWKRESCPAGQYFEPSRQACIVDVNGVCTSATVAPQDCDGVTHGSMKPDEVCNKFWLCLFGIWRPQSCDPGKMFDAEKNVCVPDDGTCLPKPPKCEEGCVKQDPECCDKYYVCVGGEWVRTSCPKGQYFEPSRQACIVDTWGVCVEKPIPPPPGCTEDCVKQDPFDCTKYLICKNGIWEQRPCPAGQYFDNSKNACVLDVWGTCIPQTQPPPTTCTDGCVKQDPECCDKYYVCSGGIWVRTSCPKGQYFEPSRQACIVDTWGVCVQKPIPPPPGCTEDCVKQDPFDCTKYLICKNGIWEQRPCPDGKYFDNSKKACVVDVWGTCIPQTQPPPTKCTDGCVKQDPNCCDRYFLCVGGEWKRESCPAGQYFEPSRQACIVDVNGVCTSATVAPQDCDGVTHGSMKPDEVCNKFWLCLFGIWRPQSCDPGKMFDAEKNVCVPDDGTCLPKPPKCEEGCVKQDPECCDKYYVCSGGIWVRTSCPKGQYFEPSRQACIVDTWGVCVQKPIPPPPGCTENCVKQDPHDCTKYLICKNGIWEQQSCSSGQYFDPSKNACVVDVWGACIPQTQPPPTECTNGCVKQDPNCCDRYYSCVDGRWIRVSCPAGQYFDPRRQACIVDVFGLCKLRLGESQHRRM